MTRRHFIWLTTALIIALLAIDQFTKHWMLTRDYAGDFGPIRLILYKNFGVMLGKGSFLPPVLKAITLSTIGGFLILMISMILYLLPPEARLLRVGLAVLLAGILGNSTDHAIRNYVVDFIQIRISGRPSPVFNLADAIQWIGYGLIFAGLFKERRVLWHDADGRGSYWVNHAFQIKFCLLTVGMALCISLVTGIFSYSYMRITISELAKESPSLTMEYLVPFAISCLLINVALGLVLTFWAIKYSHRIVGPLHALEKYVELLRSGAKRPFRARRTDELPQLQRLADLIYETVSEKEK